MQANKIGAPQPSTSTFSRSLELSRLRKKSGISLEQIADQTKISLRFLRAIEAEEFDKLPGGIFNTSYLRQYAAAIGFSEGDLLAHYDRKTNPPELPLAEQAETANRSFLDRWLRIPAQVQH